MKVIYDAATDILRIVLKDVPMEDFNEDLPGLIIDYDAEDKIIALELRHASRVVETPGSLEHIVLNAESTVS